MQPMETFDPDVTCEVHDGANDVWFTWDPDDAEHFRAHAEPWDTPEVLAWDGMLLDGWRQAHTTTQQ